MDEHVDPSIDAAQQEKIWRAKRAYFCAGIYSLYLPYNGPYDTTAGHYRTTIMMVYCQYRTTVVTAQRPLPYLPADAKQQPPHNYHTLGLRQQRLHTSPGVFDIIVGQLDCIDLSNVRVMFSSSTVCQ